MASDRASIFARSSSWWWGLALILVPSLALLGIETFQAAAVIPDVRQSQQQVVHALEVISAARALDHAIQDAERGQRGYLISGDAAYLEPYLTGIKAVSDKLDGLKKLTADHPEQQHRIALLERQIGIKLPEMKKTIDAYRSGGFAAAQRIVKTDVSSRAMSHITGLVASVIAAENDLLRERQAEVAGAIDRDKSVTALAALLALIVMGLGCVLLVAALRGSSRAHVALAQSEERFRVLVQGVRDYAIYMLDPEGNIVSWNEGAARIKGYRPEEIIGRNFSLFYEPEAQREGAPQRVLAAAVAEGAFEGEGWRVRKDGSRFWASVAVTALHDPGGKLRGFAKITRDLTIARLNQEALDRSREQLLQAQKMEAVGQLTGGVAHDFNNLLTAIIGSLELLGRRDGLERNRRLIEIARRAAEQGAGLTQQLLAFSRQQPLAPEVLDINRLVAGMSDLLRRTIGVGIAIETVLAGGLWRTRIDPNQFQSALLNLALNARDAMEGAGKLTIETGNAYLDDDYAARHAEVTPGQYVLVAVSDTGTGMSPEVMDRAFEPFYTTKTEGRGTGLGLSQVFGFIKQSGGHIKLYSEPGQGTTVKLYLPRHLGSDVTNARGEHPKTAARPAEGATVLLVEDDPNVREFSAFALQGLGYHVLEAADAASALGFLDQNPDIDLMFTDVGLPGPNGRELAEQARRRAPHLKVLFTTGYARNAVVHNGILDHGVELLAKPFTVEALGRRLAEMLRGQ
jgi:PAS domain S-box-containing protein